MSQASKTQFFACLLALPANCPRICLRGVGLTVGLAIGGAESMGGEIAIDVLGYSLWKQLISFLRCQTADKGFQVFFSLW